MKTERILLWKDKYHGMLLHQLVTAVKVSDKVLRPLALAGLVNFSLCR